MVEFRLMELASNAEPGEELAANASAKKSGDSPDANSAAAALYCPICAKQVDDPLTCGDCSSVICRRCGTPLESSDELGMG